MSGSSFTLCSWYFPLWEPIPLRQKAAKTPAYSSLWASCPWLEERQQVYALLCGVSLLPKRQSWPHLSPALVPGFSAFSGPTSPQTASSCPFPASYWWPAFTAQRRPKPLEGSPQPLSRPLLCALPQSPLPLVPERDLRPGSPSPLSVLNTPATLPSPLQPSTATQTWSYFFSLKDNDPLLAHFPPSCCPISPPLCSPVLEKLRVILWENETARLGPARRWPLAWGVSQQEVPTRNTVLPRKTNQQDSGGARRRRRRPTSQSPSHWNPSWLRDARATRKDPEADYRPSEVMGRRQPGN